ncbi:hypothetical protein [Cyanobium sp. Morenito 9A2]|uniref:hypothetical protein n=1 Tax=Cyanobium sp. Morenito 9A2 TaxID=2823718 RepID=UPI0020CC19A3|nr:hypothetical protein [Cyanobium sp. Morenito 9A2]MCP9849299.1 hypothetical protein [Cyanobium sp. Morenito 9A2]
MIAFRFLSAGAVAGFMLLACSGHAVSAQTMLPGCQLVDGTLQCVPGLTADPQQQINVLRKTIASDQKLEGAIQQTVTGLDGLVLTGQAVEGNLIWASLRASSLAGLPPSAYHWYRIAPGESRWSLIPGATGTAYTPGSADVGRQLMVVVVVPQDGGVRRVSAAPIGPVLKTN